MQIVDQKNGCLNPIPKRGTHVLTDNHSQNCDEQEKIGVMTQIHTSRAFRFGMQLSEGRNIPCRVICHFRFEFFVVAESKHAF